MFSNFYFDSIIGSSHDENQDSITCFQKDDVFFACVCDGIGSTEGSDIASRTFINTLKIWSTKIVSSEINELYLRKWFDSLLEEVNKEFFEIISQNPIYSKMSSTMCLYLCYKEKVFWFNIGDSRLYFYSSQKKQLSLITSDHTLRNYFLKSNIVNIDSKYTPYLDSLVNSICYRTKNKMQNYDFGEFKVHEKDIVIISSDGAYKFCDFNKIRLDSFQTSKDLVNEIIRLSIYNKSYDDISVGVLIC